MFFIKSFCFYKIKILFNIISLIYCQIINYNILNIYKYFKNNLLIYKIFDLN